MNVSATNTISIVGTAPAWYLVRCKPRQDERAEESLRRQGYTCYRPEHSCERIVRGRPQIIDESLFPGYLFIQLAPDTNWAPLRSTHGVNRIVGFGGMPLRLDTSVITHLQQRTAAPVIPVLDAVDSVRITASGFAGLGAIFVAMDGEQRVQLLLNMLNSQQQISMPLVSIVKNCISLGTSRDQDNTLATPVEFDEYGVLGKPAVNPKALACLMRIKPLIVDAAIITGATKRPLWGGVSV